MATYNVVKGYTIGRTLGVGTFGKVKHGIRQEDGTQVAIKIISKSQVMAMGHLNKLSREIGNMTRLTHPNIVKVYDVIDTPTYVFIIMEYIQGGELFDYISQMHRLCEMDALRIFKQIISAVAYCHSKMLCHRDLKPENIMLDRNKNVKIGDFGLSNIMRFVVGLCMQNYRNGECLKTPCGSPNYASPEVICGKYYSGPEVDIWSCGIIFYVLICGSLPFDDSEMPALFRKIRLGKFYMPGHVSPIAKQLITRMLDVNPQSRITIRELMAHPWFSCTSLGHEPMADCACSRGEICRAFGLSTARALESQYTLDVYRPHNAKSEHVATSFSLNRAAPRWNFGIQNLKSEQDCVQKICATLEKYEYQWRFLNGYKILFKRPSQSDPNLHDKFVIQLYKLKHASYIVNLQLTSGNLFECFFQAIAIMQHIISM
ncbi:bifunctional Serine-threonine-protein kinase [Babesia duncani]|uniref:Bifunctional Serine-threonine-protein kinase n=1 Tax=Babesia duncani TaxID=323732 RepID=A0AAD9PK59_9APIC|nr:bifunctional Serine-threonine-protein kinase [Babesia duncani]